MSRKVVAAIVGIAGTLFILRYLGAPASHAISAWFNRPQTAAQLALPPLQKEALALFAAPKIAAGAPAFPTVAQPVRGAVGESAGAAPTPAQATSQRVILPAVSRGAAPERAAAVESALPAAINGLPLEKILVMPAGAGQRIREVYAQGQALGRNPRAFSKVGDSTMVYPAFLAAFGNAGAFELGAYAGLQATIDYYAPAGSFSRNSLATVKGMHVASEFDPTWVDSAECEAVEGPLACELRLHNPSVAIIRLGANDALTPQLFGEQMRRIVEFCLARGIIPILGTKPDRTEGPDNTINKLVVQIAAEYRIPLWDYDLVAGTVPGRGLEADGLHIAGEGSRNYSAPAAYAAGDSLEDLTALLMLDRIRRELAGSDAGR